VGPLSSKFFMYFTRVDQCCFVVSDVCNMYIVGNKKRTFHLPQTRFRPISRIETMQILDVSSVLVLFAMDVL
jgi:hypothetical protein